MAHLSSLPVELIIKILVGLDLRDLHNSCGRLRAVLLETRGIWVKAPGVHLLPLPAGETIHTTPLAQCPRLAARVIDIQRAWDDASTPSEPKSCHIVDVVALYNACGLDATAGQLDLICIVPGNNWIILKIGDDSDDTPEQIILYNTKTGTSTPICLGAPTNYLASHDITTIEQDVFFACTRWSYENGTHRIFLSVFRLALDHDASPSVHILWQKELESSHYITKIVWFGSLLFCQVGMADTSFHLIDWQRNCGLHFPPPDGHRGPRSLQAHPFLPFIIYRCGSPYNTQGEVQRLIALELPTTLPPMKLDSPWLKASLEETSLDSVAKISSCGINPKRPPQMMHTFFSPVTNIPSDRHDGVPTCNLVESYPSTPPKIVIKRFYWKDAKLSLQMRDDDGEFESYVTRVGLRRSLPSTKAEHGSLVAYLPEENLFVILQFGSLSDPSGFRLARVQAPPLPKHSPSPAGLAPDLRFKMVDFMNGKLYYETWLDSSSYLRTVVTSARSIWQHAPDIHLLPLPTDTTARTLPLSLFPQLAARAVSLDKAWDCSSGPCSPKSYTVVDGSSLAALYPGLRARDPIALAYIIPGNEWIVVRVGSRLHERHNRLILYNIRNTKSAAICWVSTVPPSRCYDVSTDDNGILFACTSTESENSETVSASP
ncbi:hypothetical protein SISNIDRAFT_552372 [Sistotremastrum niveocremeum HHB9708]|uniref:F-box domain-containing protein n=1 Tax=Sistotremastrum niveocremeum HHB9708 TaxID=1314777 RepID=A0A164PMV2_9AGAM|nr:hypothetical protein SISNIDRAFT_552372 [Sistotremastrum niveocremeum HHB9708]